MIELEILGGMVFNEDYVRLVNPFLQSRYFRDDGQRITFELIQEYLAKYNKRPTRDALAIDLSNKTGLTQKQFEASRDVISVIAEPDVAGDWLRDQTESFCQDKAIYNAIVDSMEIAEGKDKNMSRGAIPQLLRDAVGVSFDTAVGHDFLEDAMQRYDFYHDYEERIPFALDMMNKITHGGTPRKTLNILLAGTGVGKTLVMCDFAASNLSAGKNVLYITAEMAQEKIAMRIDANLLDVDIGEIVNLSKDAYQKKIAKVSEKTIGKLIVKEFPTSAAHAGHFRHLLNELKAKRKFEPDIIYIDYLNICASSRVKYGQNVNSYTLIKSIAEELRALAIEFNVPIWSATQTNRGGFDNADVSLTDTSESFGLPATADFMLAIIRTEELDALNQILLKQLKNRYGDLQYYNKFVVGCDRPKFRLFDVESSAQSDIHGANVPASDDKPINRFSAGSSKKPPAYGNFDV
jgi:replicative DNA helicase